MTIMEWLLPFKSELATAGLAGSIVTAVMGWDGPLALFRVMTVGTLSAIYLGPLGVPLLELVLGGINVPKENAASVGGFILGIAGVSIIEIITTAFRVKLNQVGKDSNEE